jgi:dihydropyrimidine dehydrogenase (NAD+) subunit PreT
MTAIDAAMQAKLLGAEEVTVVYRRGQEHMNASLYEQELAQTNGIIIRHWMMPKEPCTQRVARFGHHARKNHARRHGKLPAPARPSRCRPTGVQGHRPDPGCRTPGGRFEITLEKGRISTDENGAHPIPRSGPAAIALPAAKTSPWSPSKTARSPLKAFTKP